MKMKFRFTPIICFALVLLSAGGVVLAQDRPDFSERVSASEPATSATEPASQPLSESSIPQSQPADVPASQPATEPTTAPADAPAEIVAAFQRGMELYQAGKLLEARDALSEVFFTYKLSAKQQEQALAALTDIAEKTLLSGKVYEGDPYAFSHTITKGDTLTKIVAREQCGVTPTIIEKINNVSATTLRVGQSIKLLRGPAFAVVDKDTFVMDLYFQRAGQPKTFVRQVRVSLGRDGGTPIGSWIVKSKAPRAMWTPPPSMPNSKPVAWGQAGYPLGKEGYWISLAGTDENTRTRTGYGLHGTDEPDSIGKAASHGCVRLNDEDIELVYSLMAERISTVVIKP